MSLILSSRVSPVSSSKLNSEFIFCQWVQVSSSLSLPILPVHQVRMMMSSLVSDLKIVVIAIREVLVCNSVGGGLAGAFAMP